MKSSSGFWLCQSQVHGIEANSIAKKNVKNQSESVGAIQNGHSQCNWLLPHWNQADHDAHQLNCFPQFSFSCSSAYKKRERAELFFLFCFSSLRSPFATIILVQRSVMIIDVARLAHCLPFELLILINHHHYPGEALLRSNSLGTFLLFIGHMLFFSSLSLSEYVDNFIVSTLMNRMRDGKCCSVGHIEFRTYRDGSA